MGPSKRGCCLFIVINISWSHDCYLCKVDHNKQNSIVFSYYRLNAIFWTKIVWFTTLSPLATMCTKTQISCLRILIIIFLEDSSHYGFPIYIVLVCWDLYIYHIYEKGCVCVCAIMCPGPAVSLEFGYLKVTFILFFYSSLTDNGNYWNNVFIAPWCRVSSYSVGVILGFILFVRRRQKIDGVSEAYLSSPDYCEH